MSSSRSSLEKDLFKTYKVDKPSFDERKKEFRTISNIFGKLSAFSSEESGSSDDEEDSDFEYSKHTRSKDSAIVMDDRFIRSKRFSDPLSPFSSMVDKLDDSFDD